MNELTSSFPCANFSSFFAISFTAIGQHNLPALIAYQHAPLCSLHSLRVAVANCRHSVSQSKLNVSCTPIYSLLNPNSRKDPVKVRGLAFSLPSVFSAHETRYILFHFQAEVARALLLLRLFDEAMVPGMCVEAFIACLTGLCER